MLLIIFFHNCFNGKFGRKGYGIFLVKSRGRIVGVAQRRSFVIPIKISFPLVFQNFKKSFFASVEGIEPNKNKLFPFPLGHCHSTFKTFGNVSVNHAFRCEIFLSQFICKRLINRIKYFPNLNKIFLSFFLRNRNEVFPKLTNGF